MISVRSLAPVGEFVLKGNGHAAKVVTAIAQDAEKSGLLDAETVIKFSRQVANAYDSNAVDAVRGNKLNILNIEGDELKSRNYVELCTSSDEKAAEILKNTYFDKDKLIGVFKSASCLSHLDKEVFVGLAKSIVAS